MTSLLQSIMSIIVVAEFVLGNFANVFIVLVNCVDYSRERQLSLADQILTALAVSRIVWLWVILINWCLTVFNPASYKRHIKFIVVSWAVANHFTSWFATTLSIFYLLKITSFSNPIFLHLKREVKSVVVAVLLGTLVILLANIIVANIYETIQLNVHEGNLTAVTHLIDTESLIAMTLSTLSNAIPFMVSWVCLLLLIYSLCKHVRKMKLHGEGSQDASTTIHMKAVYTVVSFLFLLTMHILSVITSFWYSDKALNETVHLLFQAIGILYPSSHSCVLIWGNKKLKQAFLLLAMKVRYLLKKWTPSSPRMDDENMV